MSIEEVNASMQPGKDKEEEAARSATAAGEALTSASAGILAVKTALEALFEQYRGHMGGVDDAQARMIGAQRHGESAREIFAHVTATSDRNTVLMADATHVHDTAGVVAGQLAADSAEFADPGFAALIETLGDVAARTAGHVEQTESVARLAQQTIADADEFIANS